MSLDSSLGLLKNVSTLSEFDATKENMDPGDVSLGRYLQPAVGVDESVCSQPLSDSEEDESDGCSAPTAIMEASASGFSWDKVVLANTQETESHIPSVRQSLFILLSYFNILFDTDFFAPRRLGF